MGGESNLLEICLPNSVLLKSLASKEIILLESNDIGFYPSLTKWGKGDTQLQLPLAFLSHLNGSGGEEDREAVVKVTSQGPMTTETDQVIRL